MTENNKNQTKIKFIVPFVVGVLVSSAIIAIVMSLPIFQSNMPIEFIFNEQPTISNRTDSNILPTIINTGKEAVTCVDWSDISCYGITVFAYYGTIEIEIKHGYQPPYQTVSVEIPSVSIFDMINHNLWIVGFEWNSATQQWQQQSPVTFALES